MASNLEMISRLRDVTGAGILDCKKALSESGNDFDAAIEFLRKKGVARASAKSDRIAADGVVAGLVSADMMSGVVIELNSETDFVAKSDKFQDLARRLVGAAINYEGDFISGTMPSGKLVSQEVVESAAIIGENIGLRRVQSLAVNSGLVSLYIHNKLSDGMGKIGVLVALESDLEQSKLSVLSKQLSMHIAAARPDVMNISDLNPSVVKKERDIAREQAAASGKPEAVIEKMVDGRVLKFYEQVVLLEQVFVMDGKTKISALISDFSAQNGCEVKFKSYIRFELGEGIEQNKVDLAAEVAALTQK